MLSAQSTPFAGFNHYNFIVIYLHTIWEKILVRQSLLIQKIANISCCKNENEILEQIGSLFSQYLHYPDLKIFRIKSHVIHIVIPSSNGTLSPFSQQELFDFVKKDRFPYMLYPSKHTSWSLSLLLRNQNESLVIALPKHPNLILEGNSILQIAHNQLTLLSLHERDALTGLYNRHAFTQKTQQLFSQFSQHRRSHDVCHIAFAILDIDHFKYINDTYGHLYGDEVLILFAHLLQHSFREDDLIFRYGGEEFAILLHNISLDNAEHILERFRQTVENYHFPQVQTVTVSIGYTLIDSMETVAMMVERADKALYHSKNNGRNLLSQYEKLKVQGILTDNQPKNNIELF